MDNNVEYEMDTGINQAGILRNNPVIKYNSLPGDTDHSLGWMLNNCFTHAQLQMENGAL